MDSPFTRITDAVVRQAELLPNVLDRAALLEDLAAIGTQLGLEEHAQPLREIAADYREAEGRQRELQLDLVSIAQRARTIARRRTNGGAR